MTHCSRVFLALLAILLTSIAALPVPEVSDAEVKEQAKEALVKDLETDILRATLLGAAARAVRSEQKLEDDILKTAIETLSADRGNSEKQARDLRALQELVRRDKRQVDLLGGILGGGGGGEMLSTLLSIAPSLLVGDDSSMGIHILRMLPSIITMGGVGSVSAVLGILPSLLGGGGGGNGGFASSALRAIGNLLTGGGDGASAGGSAGGSGNILSSLVGVKTNLLTSKLAPVGPSRPPVPGTYDDLIGKGISGYDPVAVFSNNLGGALRTKFTVFNSLFSLVSGLLTSSSGGSGGAGTGPGASASLSLSAST